MKKVNILFLALFVIGLFFIPSTVSAQEYRFTISATEVEVYIEEDGTLSLWYLMDFQNAPGASPIDFIDIGMPTSAYNMSAIDAEVNGNPINDIERSPYVTNGFALNLGSNAIPPGQSGTVTAWIPGVENVLVPYDRGDREDYVSFQFSPNWFDPDSDQSTSTEYRVTIILPPGVGNEEGVYYNPENWPGTSEPGDIGRTEAEDRVYYSWFSDSANAHTQYIFGGAFPNEYVPADAVGTKPPAGDPGQSPDQGQPPDQIQTPGFISSLLRAFGGNVCFCGFGLFFIAAFGWSLYQGTVGANKRKMKYLPPKMKIEGHGIKRGLTAVEAAILMEQPMDKVLTMVLFGTLKKEAAVVTQQEPLELEVSEPLPENLHPYEVDFLEAFKEPKDKRRQALQKMMIGLVQSVSKKMKGFSRKETVAYYEDIMRRAWKMVEEADTPEVKSEKYNQTLEWTMLDDEYQDRTRRTFTGGPVFVPMWWPRYSPTYRRSIGGSVGNVTGQAGKISTGGVGRVSTGGGGTSLPRIPGSDFAAGVINGTAGMAAGVVGNLTSFTDAITSRTNPIPKTSRSGSGGFRGGGGSSCACACACAGCACACAGGGR